MESSKSLNITSKIKSVTCVNFTIAPLKASEHKKLESSQFVFELNLNVKMTPANHDVEIHLTVKIYESIAKSLYLGEIETKANFDLVNFDELANSNQGMPNGVIAMFMGLLLSTTRGILLVKAENTILKGALIPIINLATFFEPPPIPTVINK